MDLKELLAFGVEQKASDLHLSAGLPPMLRKDGEIRSLQLPPLASEDVLTLTYELLPAPQRQQLEQDLEVDYAFDLPGVGRFRANMFHQHRGLAAVYRVIPSEPIPLKDLEAPTILDDIAQMQRGLVLVTGPTGSGKSTTLAALINTINRSRSDHILTVEDPIEFIHTPQRSLINQREVHRDTQSFSAALRSALREDPDVLLVGELRDLETIRLALTAAETGHLVFATLHTTSAAKTIDRIIDVFPAGERAQVRSMLSESLQAVISQILVKKINGGRLAAYEVMLASSAIRNLIREDKVPQMLSVIQTSTSSGMQTLDQHLKRLVSEGRIEPKDARMYATNKSDFD